jgi:hypothetical protein
MKTSTTDMPQRGIGYRVLVSAVANGTTQKFEVLPR